MKPFFSLIVAWIHISQALLLPFNISILRLPSQDTVLPTGEVDTNKSLTTNLWPPLPYERYMKDGLSINITAYGDLLFMADTGRVLNAFLSIQRTLRNGGEPTDVLDEITVLGLYSGDLYIEIGFYSLRPPAGIRRWQAYETLHSMWLLVQEFSQAREIVSSMISSQREEVALFRLGFRKD